jgi:hypothetical protein
MCGAEMGWFKLICGGYSVRGGYISLNQNGNDKSGAHPLSISQRSF